MDNTKATELNKLLEEKEGETSYLEIGYEKGSTFNAVNATMKVAVDPFTDRGGVIQLPSDRYFETNEDKFDVIFIDGDHRSEQVERDLVNAYACLKRKGYLVLHDCNPHNEGMQAVPRSQREWTGDVWKVCYGFINEYGEKIKWHYNDADPYGLFVVQKTGMYKVKPGFTADLSWGDYKGYEHFKKDE